LLGYLRTIEDFSPVDVPKDSLFVLGNNRDNNEDIRFWGFLHVNAVKGKAFIFYFSWDHNTENLIDMIRWSRIGIEAPIPVHEMTGLIKRKKS